VASLSQFVMMEDSERCNLWIVGSFNQIEEVAELTINQGGDPGDQDLIQIDKFISDVEESAVKLLAARFVVSPLIFLKI